MVQQTRRDFLKIVSVSGVSLASLGAIAPALGRSAELVEPCDYLIFDATAPYADTILARISHPGAAKIVYSGDIDSLWSNELLPLLQSRSARFMGLTTGFQAFAIAEFGASYGYQLAGHAELGSSQGMPQLYPRATTMSADLSTLPGYALWVMAPTGKKFKA